MATREELVVAIGDRYRAGSRDEKTLILNEFVAVTGFHRKHAMRLLREARPVEQRGRRPERRLYGEAVRTALVVVWEASDRICGKRLRALMPVLVEAMERHGVSATALRRSIPVRTFSDWGDPPPGFFEADLVAHSGPVTKGSFAQTLVLTDIATGWTECAPLLVRERTLVTAVLSQLRRLLPVSLLGFDTDNESVFMNKTVRDYCRSEGIVFTRCRPYRKNDQAWVEQKNRAVGAASSAIAVSKDLLA